MLGFEKVGESDQSGREALESDDRAIELIANGQRLVWKIGKVTYML